jgi:hypothetical protein
LARYRILEPTYLQPDTYACSALFQAGATVEFSGVPGLSMLPLDEAARAAKLASIKNTWRTSRRGDALRLARSLGGPPDYPTFADACAFIDVWITQHGGSNDNDRQTAFGARSGSQ